jgi:hypothetical protein
LSGSFDDSGDRFFDCSEKGKLAARQGRNAMNLSFTGRIARGREIVWLPKVIGAIAVSYAEMRCFQ